MLQHKYQGASFSDCPLRVLLPTIVIVNQMVTINFGVDFKDKTKQHKYVVKECHIADALGHSVSVQPGNHTNFHTTATRTNQSVAINTPSNFLKEFTLVITLLTEAGDCVEATYLHDRFGVVLLKTVAVSEMSDEDKAQFLEMLLKAQGDHQERVGREKEPEQPVVTEREVEEFVQALSGELRFLKSNGGKKHKVTDGCLLTPDSKEHCYSFELESELYLSDDAPITLMYGMDTIHGTVIVCDGFQIIVSLEKEIGEKVASAYINVEPWKLIETLRDRIKCITPKDRIAWKMLKEGPRLAETRSDISAILRGQDAAIQHALNEDITVVWGPPGTGKTYTMAQMTERFVSQGKSVLIVSHSNISVDNVVKQIYNQFSKNHLADLINQGGVLRYGFVRDEELSQNEHCVAFKYALSRHPKTKEQYDALCKESAGLKAELQFKHDPKKAERRKELEKVLKNIRAQLKLEEQSLTAKAQVVATTISKLYMDKLFADRKYDVVMFDEVSMAYVPQLLCAATYARERFICVGDFRQLAPIVQAEAAKGALQNDIFTFLNINKGNEIYNHPWLVMLNEQRRMHPRISRFSNKVIYKGLLSNHPSVVSKWDTVVEKKPLEQHPISLIDLIGTYCAAGKNADNSRFNILSALLSFALALNAEKEQQDLPFKEEEKVGIITPYAAQTRLIRAMIQDYRQKAPTAVSCATVHQFQGSERNVILFDAVESYPFVRPGWLVSKNDNGSVIRLINVALTRARCKFITLANTKFWYNKFHETRNTYFSLLEHIQREDHVVNIKDNSLLKLFAELDFGPYITPYFDHNAAAELLLKDIQAAKKKIVITLPTDRLKPEYEQRIMDALQERMEHNVIVLGKAKEVIGLTGAWRELLLRSKDAAFPLIAIDDRIVWYGFPISELYFEDKDYRYLAPKSPLFRITGSQTNEMISSLCDLDHRLDDRGTRFQLTAQANMRGGLKQYITDKEQCRACGGSIELVRDNKGQYRLKCEECKKVDLLSTFVLNRYLTEINAKCSQCRRDLYACVTQHGICARCSERHFTGLSEL